MGTYSDILKRRTIRVFQDKAVPFAALKKCVNAARLSPTARNVQYLHFIAVNDKKQVERLNSAVRFGGVVREKGRKHSEEARAFIIIVAETGQSNDYTKMDVGIAAEAIVLAAWEQNIGSCIMGAIERERIKGILSIPNEYEVSIAIAMGYPKEKPVVETLTKDSFYWIDGKGTLHIPKRSLEQVLHRDRF